MVDDNLVRRDISFAEMALLAHRYCQGPRTEAASASEAIARLYPSAGRQKRHYIQNFAPLMTSLEDQLPIRSQTPAPWAWTLKTASLNTLSELVGCAHC